MNIEADRLRGFASRLVESFGVPAEDARVVADCLVEADLEGQASHGIARLPLYARRVRDGLIAARPEMRVLHEKGAVALLDAANGLGPVSGMRAMRIAVAKAGDQGAGVCAVRRSNHLGALSIYVRAATDAGMIGAARSNTPARRGRSRRTAPRAPEARRGEEGGGAWLSRC